MTLLLRNNLAIIHPVTVKGSSGTGLIEIVKTLKKSSSGDAYVNVPGHKSHFDVRS